MVDNEGGEHDVHSDKGLNIKLLTSNAQDGRPVHDVDPQLQHSLG